jgi:hypothetical protein
MSLFKLNIDYLFNDSILGYLLILSFIILINIKIIFRYLDNLIKKEKISEEGISGIGILFLFFIVFNIGIIFTLISNNFSKNNITKINTIYEIKKLINIKRTNKIKEKDYINLTKNLKFSMNSLSIENNIKMINYFSNDEIKKIDKIICDITKDNNIYDIEYSYFINNFRIMLENKKEQNEFDETLNKINQLKNCKE